METGNGTTEKDNGRRHGDLFSANEQKGLGQSRCDCNNDRDTQQGGFIENDSQRGNTTGKYAYDGDTPAGKILQRLDQLESSHYKYVRAHQNRLKARLDESEELEKEFREEAAELRREIFELATTQESVNGNGHTS